MTRLRSYELLTSTWSLHMDDDSCHSKTASASVTRSLDRHYDESTTIIGPILSDIMVMDHVSPEQLDVLKCYLESTTNDDFNVSQFLFDLAFNKRVNDDHFIAVFSAILTLPSFNARAFARQDIFSLLLHESISNTALSSLSLKLAIAILYSVDDREFTLPIFIDLIPQLSCVPGFSLLLCAFLSSNACEVTFDVWEKVHPFLMNSLSESVASQDVHAGYRVLLAVLNLCQTGCPIHDNEISVLVDMFISCDAVFVVEILVNLISFMESPSSYGEWILSHFRKGVTPATNAIITSWLRAFEKWEFEQNNAFRTHLICQIHELPFKTLILFFEGATVTCERVHFFLHEEIMKKALDVAESCVSPYPIRFISMSLTRSIPECIQHLLISSKSTFESIANVDDQEILASFFNHSKVYNPVASQFYND